MGAWMTPLHDSTRTIRAAWLGRTSYRECWKLQKELHVQRRNGAIGDILLLTEHEPVYTVGRTGTLDHVLASREELRDRGTDLVEVDRGGDVTYHGPGQLVGYPIIDLHSYYLDLHRYLRDLEEVVIRLLGTLGVASDRHPEYTGVWIDGEKVCALGVRSSGWITMHGCALNVSTDLAAFNRIIPCGIFERGVTSLDRHVHRTIPLEELIDPFLAAFADVFHATIVPCEPDTVNSWSDVHDPQTR